MQANPGGEFSIYLEVFNSGVTGERVAKLRHISFKGHKMTCCGLRVDALSKMFGLITIATARQIVICHGCEEAAERIYKSRIESGLPVGREMPVATPASNTGVNFLP